MTRLMELHRFWFGDKIEASRDYVLNRVPLWFQANDEVDKEIRAKFSDLELPNTINHSKEVVATIIKYDQLPRHIFRGNWRSYKDDKKALELAIWAIRNGVEKKLNHFEKVFLYLPFQHAEDLAYQHYSCELFKKMNREASADIHFFSQQGLSHAYEHFEVIKTFGRFPHRNKVLGRKNDPLEDSFLKKVHYAWMK